VQNHYPFFAKIKFGDLDLMPDKLAQNNRIAKACKWGYLNKQKNLHLPLITKEKM